MNTSLEFRIEVDPSSTVRESVNLARVRFPEGFDLGWWRGQLSEDREGAGSLFISNLEHHGFVMEDERSELLGEAPDSKTVFEVFFPDEHVALCTAAASQRLADLYLERSSPEYKPEPRWKPPEPAEPPPVEKLSLMSRIIRWLRSWLRS